MRGPRLDSSPRCPREKTPQGSPNVLVRQPFITILVKLIVVRSRSLRVHEKGLSRQKTPAHEEEVAMGVLRPFE